MRAKLKLHAPKPAPFKVGTKLRYLGTSRVTELKDGKEIPLEFPGMIATVIKNDFGHQGTGRQIDVDDETGEFYYDETQDFCCVIQNEFGGQRLIHRENKKDWQVI